MGDEDILLYEMRRREMQSDRKLGGKAATWVQQGLGVDAVFGGTGCGAVRLGGDGVRVCEFDAWSSKPTTKC